MDADAKNRQTMPTRLWSLHPRTALPWVVCGFDLDRPVHTNADLQVGGSAKPNPISAFHPANWTSRGETVLPGVVTDVAISVMEAVDSPGKGRLTTPHSADNVLATARRHWTTSGGDRW